MKRNNLLLLDDIAKYYDEKFTKYGDTPQGVDWNGEVSQRIRFFQLCKIIDCKKSNFSINDLGCGYGALLDFLRIKYVNCMYNGIDISHDMVKFAQHRHASDNHARFVTSTEPDLVTDYSVASGIFNVRLKLTDAEWFNYIKDTLDALNRTSRLGFSFNCLTSYSDKDKQRDYLYYADPCKIFDLCKRRYSSQISLMHDYDLFEFTVLVRKRV
jgi:SAM-dependent methyltransferase